MPDAIIYLGPSLSRDEAESILPSGSSVEYRLPVRRGDLAGAITTHPLIIGIIDGLFFENAAIGHREILGAIRAGIRVIGASSMGALRAAELESFGMEGVGEIFHRYKVGNIESDDEVALICDPVSGEALSEALVNIRITLEMAVASGGITETESSLILQSAKSHYYPERTWGMTFSTVDLSQERKEEIRLWLSLHRYDQKGEDARAALHYIKTLLFRNV